MNTFPQVSFSTAQLLGDGNKDVIVFEPSTGHACHWQEELWPYQGEQLKSNIIIQKIGIFGMDAHYIFIFIEFLEEQ